MSWFNKLFINEAKAVLGDGDTTAPGLTDQMEQLLITILRNAQYTTDQSENISKLEEAFNEVQSDTSVLGDAVIGEMILGE